LIGTKSIAIVAVLVAVVAAAAALGIIAPDRLVARGFDTLLLVGAFGVVVGTSMFRFWRLGEKSEHYLRSTTESAPWDVSEGHFLGGDRWHIVVGENREGEARDLSYRARWLSSVAIASVIALAASDARALEKLGRASEGALSMASSYCPDEEAVKPPPRDANEPGCELIGRAYALGYAKSLGDCAPKKKEAGGEEARGPCTRRQRDEPLLHYSWRHLASLWGNLGKATDGAYVGRSRQDFRARVKHLPSLAKEEAEVITSAPHAAHHIWTNLPDPKDGAFEETTCVSRYSRLPHRPTPPPGDMRASKVFEHVVAQLLFEGTYDDAAGHCREYHVHWNAPLDVCKRLAASPEALLAATSALESVRATLQRYDVATDLASIGERRPSADPSSFVTFHCYFEGGAAERTSTPFSLAGHAFTAEELHIAPSPANASLYIDRYDAVARLLVKGFHYGSLLSEAGLEQGTSAGLESSFVGSDFLLTRLYELESIDIYLDPGWVANRPDLLEVYPYERHLKNYVQVFRRQYRRETGRL
jgi:hypothetical protein